MPRPATLDYLRSTKKPVTDEVVIAMDSRLAASYEDAKSEYDVAKALLQGKPADPQLQARFADAEEKYLELHDRMEDESAVFSFQSIGRQPYEDLVNEHRPTKEQRDEARKLGSSISYNVDTFPPACIAASSLEPRLTLAEAQELWKDPNWNQAELWALFMCAMGVNQGRRVVDLGKG